MKTLPQAISTLFMESSHPGVGVIGSTIIPHLTSESSLDILLDQLSRQYEDLGRTIRSINKEFKEKSKELK